MQYHFMCWKAMKTQNELTDKEFLEKSCYTPDCEGVIVKIQNIDKKGDLSKEFTSDFKKHSKQKWAKWEKKSESKEEKKSESKEKKRKKGNSKSEECFNGSERRSSNADDESVPLQLSSSCGSFEETSKSESNNEKSSSVTPEREIVEHQNSITDSSSENPAASSNASSFEDNKELSDIKVQENGSEAHKTAELNECIKQNVYSFMNDFLQHHGPLKVDDSLLTDEIESFPEEVHIIIAQFGGIGEFLKDDLRFAYVGDTYVCVVDDLATAYKMYSTSCLPKDFPSLDGTDDKIPYNKCNSETQSQNIGLNPDAMEYTPSNVNKNSHYKFASGNSTSQSLNSDTPAFVPAALKRLPEYQTSGTGLDTFSDSEVHVNKLNSESVLNENFPNASEPITSTSRHSKISEYCDNSGSLKSSECTYQPTSSESLNSDSKISNGENVVSPDARDLLRNSLITTKTQRAQLLSLLKIYDSEDMKPCRQELDSFIKPFVIKKSPEVASTGSMTDAAREKISKDADVLSEQNLLLRRKLESATQKEQQLMAEVEKLQKHSQELEVLKKECENKEQEMVNSRKYLLESLTNAHETIDNQKQKLTLLTDEKNSLQKTIGQLNVSLKMSEEKLKSTLDAKEKHFNSVISNLQDEREELKDRAKYAELQVLHLKKTEYLKKIEEKSHEANKRRKELTDGLSMVSSNLNPVLQGDMKALATQLLTYANNLASIKLDFVRKIDEKIEMVNKGTPLKEIKELEMKELPEIPCWRNSVPVNGRTLDKQALNPIKLPVSFGLNMPATHQVSTDFKSSFTTDTPMIPGTKVPPTKAVPAAAAIAPPSAAVATPVLSSTIKSNASSKTELSNGIDFGINSQIEESFKNAMASINSFASTPYVGPTLDDEFPKNSVVFKHTDPVPANKPEIPKVPPGIQNASVPAIAPRKVLLPDPIIPTASPRKTLLPDPPSREKRLDSLDTVPISEAAQSTWDLEKKKAASGKNSYEKLLIRLKEHFPQYSQEELMSFVKEFRAQRQGKLSGLPIDTIVNHISNLIMEKKMSEKKVSELKALPKSTKVLVNKKLVSDPKPSTSEQQSVKKKAAWGLVDSEARRNFSGSLDDDCVICCDPMTSSSAYKVSCGHTFHETCIRQWLQTQSNCPVCRNLLLLPDEYPSLS